MRTIKFGTIAGIALAALLPNQPMQSSAQTNDLDFNSVGVLIEGAIRLSWNSVSNEVYEVDEADSLVDTNTGTITWNMLYKDYPSHGTNTFWLDTGNYLTTPVIPHPKYSLMRFYRIVNEGTNSGEAPSVLITSPANGAVISDVVTVSVTTTSSYPYVTTKLYVDGQEMSPSKDGTNYFINTCEWPNGPHTLFATGRALSGYPGASGSLGIVAGRAVSAYVPVTFSNLITSITFSQWLFEPSQGQTQQVTASFAASVDWTLQILDDSSNAVRTVTGSGASLLFDWDGTGDGGTTIADGVYHYFISVDTNGLALPLGGSTGGDSGGSGSPPSPSFVSPASLASDSSLTQLWAISPNGSGDAAPLALYPPGSDTNGFTIFEEPLGWSPFQKSASSAKRSFAAIGSGSSGAGPDFSGPSSQSTTAPTRPPTAAIKNPVNSYGLAYWDFPNSRTLGIPGNGQPFPVTGHVHLDGSSSSSAGPYENLWDGASIQLALRAGFQDRGSTEDVAKHDDQLSSHDLRRSDQGYNGGELFTSVTIGVFLGHGSYGTDPDYSAGSSASEQTYFPSGNPGDNGVNTLDNGWLRMCQFGFGGSLKWMVFEACFSLTDPNYGSMSNVGAIPLKTTHMLLGAKTATLTLSSIYQYWADNLFDKKETIIQGWFDAGRVAYQYTSTNEPPIIFRVTGYPECLNDTIATNTGPTSPSAAPRNLDKRDGQVFP